MRCQCEPTDQRRRRFQTGEGNQRLLDLSEQAGHRLHIPSVLPAHVIQRMTDLAEGMSFDGFHQGGEDVLAIAGGFLEVGEAGAVARARG